MPSARRSFTALDAASLLAVCALATGCAGGRSPQRAHTMPNPDGCFVQVWDRPGFAGTSEFLNGPRRYEHLEDLPGRLSWKNRVRSVRLGPSAVAVVWADEGFEGRPVLLTADSPDPAGFRTLPMNVESLDVRCVSPGTRVAESATGDGPTSQ